MNHRAAYDICEFQCASDCGIGLENRRRVYIFMRRRVLDAGFLKFMLMCLGHFFWSLLEAHLVLT